MQKDFGETTETMKSKKKAWLPIVKLAERESRRWKTRVNDKEAGIGPAGLWGGRDF
jgi:hypothetical protein